MSSPEGRFLSPDPENAGASPDNPQSWNGYGYALNSPLKYVDPDGLAADCNFANSLLRTGAGVQIPNGMPLSSYDSSSKSFRTLQANANGSMGYDFVGPLPEGTVTVVEGPKIIAPKVLGLISIPSRL